MFRNEEKMFHKNKMAFSLPDQKVKAMFGRKSDNGIENDERGGKMELFVAISSLTHRDVSSCKTE